MLSIIQHVKSLYGKAKVDNKLIKKYDQIDYVICQENQKHMLCNSRSYLNILANAGHRIVVTKMTIHMNHLYKKENRRRNKPFNNQLLKMNENIKNQYKTELKSKQNNK